MVEGCCSCYEVGEVLCVCMSGDIIDVNVFGDLVVETSDPRAFYTLYKGLRKVVPVVESLVRVTKAYDMPQFISTHSCMDRRVARLMKLLKILDSLWLEVDTLYSGRYCVSFKQLARPAVEVLEHVLRVLEYFKGRYHRSRDRVHQYLYPVILSVLDTLREVKVVLKPWAAPLNVRYRYVATHEGIELKIDTPHMFTSKRVTDREFEKLLSLPADQIMRTLSEIVEKRLKRLKRKLNPTYTNLNLILR